MASINPSTGTSTQTSGATQNAKPYLSAEWINERIVNVRRKVRELLIQRIISRGLLASGYKPFQFPLTDEILLKMTPDQLKSLVQSMPTVEDRAVLLNRIRALKLSPLDALFSGDESLGLTPSPSIPNLSTMDIENAPYVPYAEG